MPVLNQVHPQLSHLCSFWVSSHEFNPWCYESSLRLDGGLKANVLIPYGGIIGACMLVFHFWVSLVVDACDTLGTTQEKHDALLKNADIFEGTIKSLEVNRMGNGAKSTILALCE